MVLTRCFTCVVLDVEVCALFRCVPEQLLSVDVEHLEELAIKLIIVIKKGSQVADLPETT